MSVAFGERTEHEILSHEETLELIKEAQAGSEEALGRLVECNTNLVWKVAHRYSKRQGHLLEEDDVFQIGVEGLIDSIMKFDLSKKVKLTTYASRMINWKIIRELKTATEEMTIHLDASDIQRHISSQKVVS